MLDRYLKTKVFTYVYSLFLFIYAVSFVISGWESYKMGLSTSVSADIIIVNDTMYRGIQGLVLIASFMLIVSSRLSDAMQPVMMLVVISTACYDSADKFLSPDFLWVAPFAVFGFVFHFMKYRKPFRIGSSFLGLCAISIALLLGGLGTISSSDYFSGSSLFYVFGLGVGMMLFYLLIKAQMNEEEKQNVARVMYLVGLLAAFSIFWLYYWNWDALIGAARILRPQLCNNLSTLLMMSLPFTIFYPSRKIRYLDFLAFILMYIALAVSGSRGGLIFGTLEILILLTIYCFWYRKGRAAVFSRVVFFCMLTAGCFAAWYFLPELLHMLRLGDFKGASRFEVLGNLFGAVFDSGEARMKLLGRMIRDFSSNPIFGAGLGNMGNIDLYNPVKGAMPWYHMWIPQIVGSLGLVGIAAYGYQLFARVRIYLKNPSFVNRTFFLSYIGLLLMSQVNPGEFCPVPYAMLAVTFFVLIERPEDDIVISDLLAKRKSHRNS